MRDTSKKMIPSRNDGQTKGRQENNQRPPWCEKRFIQPNTIVAARERLENLSSSRQKRNNVESMTTQRGIFFYMQKTMIENLQYMLQEKSFSLMTSFMSEP